ncbi:MAG: anthranilate synthase component I [Eubacteriales bacterium]|nr:anthranilate synthase component I [Eubacteriales bacterium]MDD3349871.1 anthranilate synthase component I [Eubacteriales bacterium]
MIYPKLEEITQYIAEYANIPIVYELLADTFTPISVFQGLASQSKNCFLLESAENAEQFGRYSFIGTNPLQEIQIKEQQITIRHRDGNSETFYADAPLAYIDELANRHKSPRLPNMPHLSGGLVGYFGYDTIRYVEKKLSNVPKDDLMLPDCHLLLCDEIIAFDHFKHSVMVIVNIETRGDVEENYLKGVERAKQIAAELGKKGESSSSEPPRKAMTVQSNLSSERFCENVLRAKKHITEGDIFQIVLSQRFEVENPPDSFDTYRVLRSINPSPYMFYFKFDDYYIAGASPELLVSVSDGIVSTRPIAGTIRRGKDEAEDKKLENIMISDPKEIAEHAMLLDLGRNDVGKVSAFGTVEITRLMAVERYSSVMHIVSDVKGQLRPDKTGMDALMAVLPAGTLSGAPKVRAMELIDEIEETKRCLYGGTVGYIGFDKRIDTCIAIRTILFKNDKAYIQAGAGIVADSVPENEYEETKKKAEAMIEAIKKARRML